ncbi:FecCD family ABC transporter permease [Micromonospora tarensis]
MSTAVRHVAITPELTLDTTPTVTRAAPPASGSDPAAPPRRRGRRAARAAGLVTAVALLAVIVVLSIAVGAKAMPLADVWSGLLHRDAAEYAVVHRMRLPRTLLGLLAGAALGVAGAVMQALTRNPLADPGLLGINAGRPRPWPPPPRSWASPPSAGTSGSRCSARRGDRARVRRRRRSGRDPGPPRAGRRGAQRHPLLVRERGDAAGHGLPGAAAVLDGRLAGQRGPRHGDPGAAVHPGRLLVALGAARPLNALALGDDAARALGARPALIRAAVIVAVTLLCGAATAACGPIVFVGLLVPHLVRALTGPDLRWLLPYCAVLAPALLLGADVLGRVLGRPGELQVGMVTAVLGGPLFLWLVSRVKVAHP